MQKDNFILFCPFHKTYYNLLPHLVCPGNSIGFWHVCCPDCGRSNIKGKFTNPNDAIDHWNTTVGKVLSKMSTTKFSDFVSIPIAQIFVVMENDLNFNCLYWSLFKDEALKELTFHTPGTVNLEVFSPECSMIGSTFPKDNFWFVFVKGGKTFSGYLMWFKTRKKARDYVKNADIIVSSPIKWTYSYTVEMNK